MYTSDEAKTDFILVIAAMIMVPIMFSFVLGPLFRAVPALFSTPVEMSLSIVFLFLQWLAMPLFLISYRRRGLTALGWESLSLNRPGALVGLIAIVVATFVVQLTGFGAPIDAAALGAFSALFGEQGLLTGPALFNPDASRATETVLRYVALGVQAAAFAVVIPFLTVTSRDAWRGQPISQLMAVRRFGLGAAAATGVLSLLALFDANGPALGVLVVPVALVALVLVSDGWFIPGEQTARATFLAPTALVFLTTFGGVAGLFSADPGLYFNTAAQFGIAVLMSLLIESRRGALGQIALAIALAIYPAGGLSPNGIGL